MHLQEAQSGSRLRPSSRHQRHPREEGQERRAPAITACRFRLRGMQNTFQTWLHVAALIPSLRMAHGLRPARFRAKLSLLPKLKAGQGTKALRAVQVCLFFVFPC